MVRIGKRDKDYQRKVAAERVGILLRRAREVLREDEELARRYVYLAVRVARKHQVKLGKRKYTFCRRCFVPWTPETVKVRLVTRPYPTVVYRCLRCGAEYRIPYVREKKGEGVGVSNPNGQA